MLLPRNIKVDDFDGCCLMESLDFGIRAVCFWKAVCEQDILRRNVTVYNAEFFQRFQAFAELDMKIKASGSDRQPK